MADQPTSTENISDSQKREEDLSQKNPFEVNVTDTEKKEINEAKLMAGCCYTGCYDCPWEHKIS